MTAMPASLPRSCLAVFVTASNKPAADHWELYFDAVDLFAEWKPALLRFLEYPNVQNMFEVCNFMKRAVDINARMEHWARNLPPQWGYSLNVFNKHFGVPWLMPLMETSWIPRWTHHYSSALIEFKWREWWTLSVVLHQAIIQSMGHLESKGFAKETWPVFVSNVRRGEVELSLVTSIDGLFESSMSILTRPMRGKPEPKDASEVCSLRGFLLYPQSTHVHRCLMQTPFVGVDMDGRREWSFAMIKFLDLQMGFVKCRGSFSDEGSTPLHIQFWSLE
jgi:hypothetical protein